MRSTPLALAALLLAPCVAAQSRDSIVSPVALATAILRAQKHHDWATVLRLADSRAIAHFKREIVGMMSLTLDMPTHSAYADKAQRNILSYMFGVTSVTELKATPADTVLVRFFEYTESSGPWPEPTIVGFVSDGDTLAYVIIRRVAPKMHVTDSMPESVAELAQDHDESPIVDIMTARRDEHGHWRSMLDGGIVFSMGGFGLSLRPEDEPPP